MGYSIQQGNNVNPLDFLLVLSSDHITGATGKTVTVTICKNGGAFSTPVGSVVEKGLGWYSLTPSPSDANILGPLLLHATASGCDPRDSEFSVVNYNPSLVLPSSPPTSATFGTIRGIDLLLEAFDDLGIKQSGETLPAADAIDGLRRLNGMCDALNLQPGWLLNEQREVFDLVAGQGTPDNPYTMGPGGDFDTTRPVWVKGFGLLLNNASPPVEIPLTSFTDDAYEALAIKSLGSTQPTGVYFNSTQPLASIYLYPIPTSALNDLVIYSLAAVPGFANLTTQYTLAPGYREALHYNLAKRLAAPYGQPWTAELNRLAVDALRWIKTANTRMVDLRLDPALTHGSRRPYNILSGT